MKIDNTQQSTNSISDTKQDKKLKQACKDFEAVFVNSLMKSMRKTVMKTNLLGSDSGEEMFQDMMDSEISKSVTKRQSMGIADALYHQLSDSIARQKCRTNGD